MKPSSTTRLQDTELKVINIGVKTFYEIMKEQGVRVIQVDWRPPAGGDPDLVHILDKLG